jgi:hypothetical protein
VGVEQRGRVGVQERGGGREPRRPNVRRRPRPALTLPNRPAGGCGSSACRPSDDRTDERGGARVASASSDRCAVRELR